MPVLEKEMREAAEDLDFELAIQLRDQINLIKKELGQNKEEI